MKKWILIMAALPLFVNLSIAQKTYKVNENYEKLMAGTTAFDLDCSDDFGFMITDLAPGSAAVGSVPTSLLVFNKKTNTLSKAKISLNHKKDEMIGSVAVDDKIILFYSGKSKSTKKNGLHSQVHGASGDLISSASFFESDAREAFFVKASTNKQFIIIGNSKNIKLLSKDLKVVHEKINLTTEFQDALVTNDGSVIVEGSVGGKIVAKLFSPQGDAAGEVSYDLGANSYSFSSKVDDAGGKLYVAALTDDGTGKKAKSLSNRLQVIDLKTFKSLSVADQAIAVTIGKFSFPNIYVFGDKAFVISQEVMNDSKEVIAPKNNRERYSTIKNYVKIVADRINISSFTNGKAVANNSIERHVATDGNFLWMLETNMFLVKGEPMLIYYTLGNVSIGSYNYKLHTARLDESLKEVGMKETATSEADLNINHLHPMSGDGDKFYYMGWKSLKQFGSAELTF